MLPDPLESRVMSNETYTELRATACDLAEQAGEIILRYWGRAVSRRKADGSEVTDADLASQDCIIEALARRYPDHDVLAEETHSNLPPPRGARYCWVVDPLDGTQNFARGFPCFATSIALLEEGVPVVGVVREHVSGRVYSAASRAGASVDGVGMNVARREMNRGFIVSVPSMRGDDQPTATRRLLDRVNVRSLGSAAVNMALVATGALDAAFAQRCFAWDVAAGYLLVTEAGGVCTSPDGGSVLPLPPSPDPRQRTPYLASGPHVHAELIGIVSGPATG